MRSRGLTVGLLGALLCAAVGVAGGLLVGYLEQPRPTYGDLASPIPAASPSVPIDRPTRKRYARDISYPPLSPDLPLQGVHTMRNSLAVWTYHVPQSWGAYSATSSRQLTQRQTDNAQSVRFKPPDEPDVGGYSLYVKIIDNTIFDSSMAVAAKIAGFSEASGVADFQVLKQTQSSVYFEYRDQPSNLHRYNYFAWFSVPGDANATLQVSVAGRRRDVPGLKALLTRFTDDAFGTHPPSPPSSPTTSPPTSAPTTGSTGGPSPSGTSSPSDGSTPSARSAPRSGQPAGS